MKLRGLLVPVSEITPARCDEMFSLMNQHYQNVTKAGFLADLAEKQWVIMLQDPQTNHLERVMHFRQMPSVEPA